MALDAAFFPALAAYSDAPPSWVLLVLDSESGLNPAALNSLGYAGLNQISSTFLRSKGIDPNDYVTWPASRQLTQVVLPFISAQVAFLKPQTVSTPGVLYGLNFLPGRVKSNGTSENSVLTQSPEAYYTANKGLDFNKDGSITIGDLDAFLYKLSKTQGYQNALAQLQAADPSIQNPYESPPPLPPTQTEAQAGKILQGLLIGGAVVGAGAVAWHAYKTSKPGHKHSLSFARSNPLPKLPKLTKKQSLLLGGTVVALGAGTAIYILSRKSTPALSSPNPNPNPNPSDSQSVFGAAVLADARADLGVSETNNSARVMQYLANYGFTTPVNWCAAAVGTWIREAAKSISASSNLNIKAPIPGSASARSTGDQFNDATNPKVGWWSASELQSNPNLVMPGMVVVWSRGAASSHLGHIGIVSSVNPSFSNGTTRSGNPTDSNYDFKSVEGNSGPTGGVVGEWPHSVDSVSLVGMGYFDDAAIGISPNTTPNGIGYLVDPPGAELFEPPAPELATDSTNTQATQGFPQIALKLLKA